MATETARLRHSQAASCSRALGYAVLGVPDSDPMDLAGTWVTNLGTDIHAAWQQSLDDWAATKDGVTVETEVICSHAYAETAGHADALVTFPDGHKVCIELKTINGTGFKRMFTGKAEGPRWSAVVQGCLNAAALDANELVIAYLAMESMSQWQADKAGIYDVAQRFSRDVSYNEDDIHRIASHELTRWRDVLVQVDNLEPPERFIPLGDGVNVTITNPETGAWRDAVGKTGKTWQCDYCRYQQTCVADGE